mmetsp:Transcript_24725/g.49578  ORF Transcript_24725/g.49578 Transcript_24725/m.49578 type:complete len:262 (+) Transcript_24725:1757-2542(+)
MRAVGLNLPGGDALIELRDTTFEGMVVVNHHGADNGGLLAAHFLFSGDTSGVQLLEIQREYPNHPSAVVVTVDDVPVAEGTAAISTNYVVDPSRAAFPHADLGCESAFGSMLRCGAQAGELRPLKLYTRGSSPIIVRVSQPEDASDSQPVTFVFPVYEKESNAVSWFASEAGAKPVYAGYAFVVRAGSAVQVVAAEPIAAVDFGHTGWEVNRVVSIVLSVDAPGSIISGCQIRTDHPRLWMTPYGPLYDVGIETLCNLRSR